MTSILFIIIPLIVVLLIGVVSWVLYRIHLDKAVRGEASASHTRLLSPAEFLPWLAVILLLVWNAISLGQFSHTFKEIDQLQLRVMTMQNEMLSLPDEIARKIGETESLLSSCSWTLEGLDKENKTARIRVTLTPKTLTEDTTISLSLASQTAEMKKSGSQFTADMNISLFEGYGSAAQAVITSGGVSRYQAIPDLTASALWMEYLPSGDILNSSVIESLDGTALTLKGSIDCCLRTVSESVSPTEVYLLFEQNKTEVKRIAADLSGETVSFNVSGSYELSGTDGLEISLLVKNDMGLSVKRVLWYHVGEQKESDTPGLSVLAEDGTVLFAD